MKILPFRQYLGSRVYPSYGLIPCTGYIIPWTGYIIPCTGYIIPCTGYIDLKGQIFITVGR
jgi:hypothetical protein